MQAPLVSGTSTELIIAVPGLANGPDKEVTVIAYGNKSNSLKLTVDGFPGQLHWVSISEQGEPNLQQFMVSANADGSSSPKEREVVKIPSYFVVNSPYRPISNFAFHRNNNELFYTRDSVGDQGSIENYFLGKVSDRWTDFSNLKAAKSGNENGFELPGGLAVSNQSSKFFFFALNQNFEQVLFSGPLGVNGPITRIERIPSVGFERDVLASSSHIYGRVIDPTSFTWETIRFLFAGGDNYEVVPFPGHPEKQFMLLLILTKRMLFIPCMGKLKRKWVVSSRRQSVFTNGKKGMRSRRR